MFDSFVTPWTIACQPPGLWDFPGKNTGVGCHFLLQEIFLTQGLNPGLLHSRQILYCLSYQGSPKKPNNTHQILKNGKEGDVSGKGRGKRIKKLGRGQTREEGRKEEGNRERGGEEEFGVPCILVPDWIPPFLGLQLASPGGWLLRPYLQLGQLASPVFGIAGHRTPQDNPL